MRTTPKLRTYLRRLRRKAPPLKTPLPDNPYHRCFTANRSFEELARARKTPPAGR